MDGKALSAMIRKRKKQEGEADLAPDMDYAGQEAVDPNDAWDDKLDLEVNTALDEPDHEPATESEMGENESSQDESSLSRSMARIERYLEELLSR